jgi:hypothetical protein
VRRTRTIAVEWADRAGATQRIVLDSVIARSDPIWSGALAVGAEPACRAPASVRSPFVPVTARSLGGGRSALKATTSGSTAIVFDDRSGEIVSRCNGIAATTATRDLAAGDLRRVQRRPLAAPCRHDPVHPAVPPLAADAQDVPPALAVTLALVGGSYAATPDCSVEAMKTVRYSAGGSVRIEAVPLDAVPASLGLVRGSTPATATSPTAASSRPRADGRWSGRSALVPAGWTIGSGSGDRRVCRYVADSDGSGTIDANIEHPLDYVDVAGSLLAQNFLVVRGDQACPAASEAARVPGLGTLHISLTVPTHALNDIPPTADRPSAFAEPCARRSRSPSSAVGLSDPNPRVGCVIVDRGGRIVGRGHTQETGGPHAEVMALRDAAGAAPTCAAPPSSSASSRARITAARRRAPMRSSPRRRPGGDGDARSESARRRPGRRAPRGGRHRGRLRPVRKTRRASSTSASSRAWSAAGPGCGSRPRSRSTGRSALDNGVSQWITGEAARADGHAWRKRAGALLTGVGTVLDDDPRLDVRLVPPPASRCA